MDKINDHTSRITIELDKELKKKVVLYCAEKDLTVKEFLTNLIKEKIN